MKKEDKKPSGLAIAALITGISGLSFIPIIIGTIDLKRIEKKKSGSEGRIFDIIGIALGIIGLMVIMIVMSASVIIMFSLYMDKII